MAISLSADEDGTLWIATPEKKILRYENKWIDTGIEKANYVAAGPPDHVYALAAPRKDGDETIYRYLGDKWIEVPGRAAEEMGIGLNGRLFITSDRPFSNRIFESHPFTTSHPDAKAKATLNCKTEQLILFCEGSEYCKSRAETKFGLSQQRLTAEVKSREQAEARE
jgi:hypothetical protein